MERTTLPTADKIAKLEECIALLQDADCIQQAVLEEDSEEHHNTIEFLISELETVIYSMRLSG